HNPHGNGAGEVTPALKSSNQSTSVGTIDKGKQDVQVRVSGEYETLDDSRETNIQTEEAKQLHISDVAEVKDRFKKEGSRTLVNGEPSVVLSFLKNSDANTVDVARAIDASKDELNEQLPEGAELTTVIDTSDFIEESVSSVTHNLLLGGIMS